MKMSENNIYSELNVYTYLNYVALANNAIH